MRCEQIFLCFSREAMWQESGLNSFINLDVPISFPSLLTMHMGEKAFRKGRLILSHGFSISVHHDRAQQLTSQQPGSTERGTILSSFHSSISSRSPALWDDITQSGKLRSSLEATWKHISKRQNRFWKESIQVQIYDFHTSVHSTYRKPACEGELAGAFWKLR